MSHQFPPHERPPHQWNYRSPYSPERSPYPPGYPYQPPPRRHPARLLVLLLGAIVVAVLAVAGVSLLGPGHEANRSRTPLFPGGGSDRGSSQVIDAQAVAAQVSPALVNITTTLGYAGGQSAGTGMVLTSDGEVLTNNHVVAGATSIEATSVGNGKTYRATVVGYDRSHDVAVLKLDGAAALPTVAIGDSSDVGVGDAIVGLGNAGGAGGAPSVAPGTVTGLDVSISATDASTGSIEQLDGMIQVNANIQSGDSGGPLVNSSSEVVGMNTAAATGYDLGPRKSRGGTETSGYAIPINQAMSIARQIESGIGSDTVHIGPTAFLGVSVTGANSGADVAQVVPGGPADAAGVRPGDVIVAIDGAGIDSATTLTTVMDTHHPGDRVTLTWLDFNGIRHSATVTLIEGPVG